MRVKYVTIIVRDMEESIVFYREAMGFEVDSRFEPAPGLIITLMRSEGDTMVELIMDSRDEAGFYSFGMDVDDLRATIELLRAKGARITMEPTPISVGLLAFCEDPNGARIALIQHETMQAG